MHFAEGETEGLRYDKTQAREDIKDTQVAKAYDDYFAAAGAEYITFTNLENAREALSVAETTLEEKMPEFMEVQNDLEDAEWELSNATN